jgi:hypothetical protein
LGAFALLFLAASFPGPIQAGKYPELELRKQGWTVDRLDLKDTDRPGTRSLFADGRIMLPARDVWRVIAGDSGKEWPGINESVLEATRGDTTIRRYKLDIPIFEDRTYRLRMIRDDEKMRLRFAKVPGYGNVHEINGTWEVRALSDTASRIQYRLETDPGVKLVPGFIIKWATKKAIPRSFAHIYDTACETPQQSIRLGGGD